MSDRFSGIKLVSVFLLILVSGCAYFNTFYNARKNYGKAVDLIEENPDRPSSSEAGYLNDAIEGAARVLSFYPESRWADDAQLLIGDALYLLGKRSLTGSGRSNFEEAMLAYSALLVSTDDQKMMDRANIGMGLAAIELERYGDAAAAFCMVSGKDKRLYYRSRIFLADALVLDHYGQNALSMLDTLTSPSNDSLAGEILIARGKALMDCGMPDSAAAVCLEAGDIIGRGEGFCRAMTFAAQFFIEAGKPEKAGDVLDVLLLGYRSDREMAKIALLSGRAREMQGDNQSALVSYASAVELDLSEEWGAEAIYRRALLNEKLGRINDALNDLEIAEQRSGSYLWTRLAQDRKTELDLLNGYMNEFETVSAEKRNSLQLLIAEKRIDLYGTDDDEAVSILLSLSSSADSVNRARTLVLLTEILPLDPDSSRKLLEEAYSLSLPGDLGTALEERLGIPRNESAYRKRPAVLLSSGWIHFEEGRYNQAWEIFSEALESSWSDNVRPELLWAIYLAAEAARLESYLLEDYLNELASDYSGTIEGGWARERLLDQPPEEPPE